MELNYKRNWLWVFICIFTVIWLGSDIIRSFLSLETFTPRTISAIQYEIRPIWFSIVIVLKSLVVAASAFYLILIIKNGKNT